MWEEAARQFLELQSPPPAMLERGQHWPSWLPFCLSVFLRQAAEEKNHQHTKEGPHQALCQLLLQGAWQGPPNRPHRAALLAHAAACRHAGLSNGNLAAPADLAEQLLAEALGDCLELTQGSDASRREPVCPKPVREPEALPEKMPVLLVRRHNGLLADLDLQRIVLPAPAASEPLFVPAPASYLVELDAEFQQQLAYAAQLVQQLAGVDLTTLKWRLMWDIKPRGPADRWAVLKGPSAGAALAVGALALVRPWLPASLAEPLGRIAYGRAAVTAALAGDGARVDAAHGLADVGGLTAKIVGLAAAPAGYHPLPALWVAAQQWKALQEAREPAATVVLHGVATVPELVRQLGHATNADNLYGAYPDVVRELQGAGGRYGEEDFQQRPWLTHALNSAVAELGSTGGLVLLEAPLGWGKTSVALDWVRGNLRTDGVGPARPLDGWVFARQENGTVKNEKAGLTSLWGTLVQQLESCTRHRMAMVNPRRRFVEGVAQADEPYSLDDLLQECSRAAATRAAGPVVLLVDALDEADMEGQALGTQLPARWPTGVVLVLLGRSSAFDTDDLESTDARPVQRLALHRGEHAARVNADLAAYVARRCAEIDRQSFIELDATFQAAVVHASEGHFAVAALLLRRRWELVDELRDWRNNPATLPRGLQQAFDGELKRAVQRVRRDRLPQDPLSPTEAGRALHLWLGWLALGPAGMSLKQAQTLLQQAMAMQATDTLAATALDEGLGPLELLAGREPGSGVRDAPELRAWRERLQACAADLFGLPALRPGSPLRFCHPGLRDRAEAWLAKADLLAPMHALWGALCEAALANPQKFAIPERHMLGHAAAHLAHASAWSRDAWHRAAGLLQDIQPDESGYLNRLFDHGPLKQVAWQTLQGALPVLLLHAPNDEPEAADVVLRLRSLRHVLADQHDLVAHGWMPLVAALYNRQAGWWTDQTAWGKRLLACALACERPWIRALDISRAAAIGPLVHRVGDKVSCIATSESGRWVVAGLNNGDTFVWSREQLAAGMKGELATRHAGAVSCVSIVDWKDSSQWLLASGSFDNTTRVLGSEDLSSRVAAGDQSRATKNRSILLGQVATRHGRSVRSIALVAGREPGQWVLASGGDTGTTRVQTSEELRKQIECGQSDDTSQNVDVPIGHLATRHRRNAKVTSVALITTDDRGDWILASGGTDGTTRVLTSHELSQSTIRRDLGELEPAGHDPLGRVATHHRSNVRCVALVSLGKRSDWVLASGSDDGTTRVLWGEELRQWKGECSSEYADVDREGLPGQVATRHGSAVNCIALIATGGSGQWILASGDRAGSTRLIGSEQLRPRQEANAYVEAKVDRARRLCHLATRHGTDVSSATLVATGKPGEWLLASSSQDGSVRTTDSVHLRKRIETGYQCKVEDEVKTPLGDLAIRHRGCVESICLIATGRPDQWLLASGGLDNTVRVVGTGELNESTEFGVQGHAERDRNGVSGQLVTRHEGNVSSVALIEAGEPGKWILASFAYDHTTRVLRRDDLRLRLAKGSQSQLHECDEEPLGLDGSWDDNLVSIPSDNEDTPTEWTLAPVSVRNFKNNEEHRKRIERFLGQESVLNTEKFLDDLDRLKLIERIQQLDVVNTSFVGPAMMASDHNTLFVVAEPRAADRVTGCAFRALPGQDVRYFLKRWSLYGVIVVAAETYLVGFELRNFPP